MEITTYDFILSGAILVHFVFDKLIFPINVGKKLAKTKSELDEKIEALKSLHVKEEYIHKLQFEKEFRIYLDLWKKLLELRKSTSKLSLPKKMKRADLTDEQDEAEKEKKFKEFITNYDKVEEAIMDHKPFIGEVVYENSDKIHVNNIQQKINSEYSERFRV